MPETTSLQAHLAFDKGTAGEREAVIRKLGQVRFTPLEGQVAFIKELVKQPTEARKFIADPKQYAVDHGILLAPDVVKKVNEQVLYDVALDEEFCGIAGPHVTKDLVDLRDRLKFGPGGIKPVGPGGDPVNPVANAAVVAAAAAVAVAAVAVVTMVVTLVRAKRPADLVSLQGLGAKGVLLPGNQPFINRTDVAAIGGIAAVRGMQGIR